MEKKNSSARGDSPELLTTALNFKMLVGEGAVRAYITRDLLVEEEPSRDGDQPFPLGDVAAWVSHLEAKIEERGRVRVKGEVEGEAIYYSASGPKELKWAEAEFDIVIGLPGALPGMQVSGYGRVYYLFSDSPPLEAEGKLVYQLEIEVEVLLCVVDPQQLEVAVGVKELSSESVTRELLLLEELWEEKREQLVLAGELLSFGEEVKYVKSLHSYLSAFSWHPDKEGIKISGELVTSYYFRTGKDGGLREYREHFTHSIPFPDLSREAKINIWPRVEYSRWKMENGGIRKHSSIDILIRVTRTMQQEVISEIEGANVKKEHLQLYRETGTARETLEMVQRHSFPYPLEVVTGPLRVINLEVDSGVSAIRVAGMLEKNIYYTPAPIDEEEGQAWPLVSRAEDEFEKEFQLPEVTADTPAVAFLSLQSVEFAPAEAATLQLCRALLEVKTWEITEFPVVVPSPTPPGTSMVVYVVRSGDTLLKVARRYGVDSQLIINANNLPEDASLEQGQKLFIPLMLAEQ